MTKCPVVPQIKTILYVNNIHIKFMSYKCERRVTVLKQKETANILINRRLRIYTYWLINHVQHGVHNIVRIRHNPIFFPSTRFSGCLDKDHKHGWNMLYLTKGEIHNTDVCILYSEQTSLGVQA